MRRLAALGGALLWLSPSIAVGGVPDWLSREARRPVPPGLVETAPAVVLRVDTTIDIGLDGSLTTRERTIVLLRESGNRADVAVRAVYAPDSERLVSFRGWLVPPSGGGRSLDGDDVVDAAVAPNDLYNEARVKILSVPPDAPTGAVFGVEWTLRSEPSYPRAEWRPADRLPVVEATCLVRLDGGRAIRALGLGGTFAEERPAPGVAAFSIRGVPGLRDEDWAPPASSLRPRLLLGWPASEAAFAWGDVSAWLAARVDPAAVPGATVRARAREIAPKAIPLGDRVAALASWVQRLPYVSIQAGIGRGGGFQPRPADRLLEQGYGDCKDKVTLLRALLSAIGVESYFVAVSSSDFGSVRRDWPSPHEFDHAIIAIRAPTIPLAAAALEHPGRGRLLLFDPTDAATVFGELPASLQGGFGLIAAPGEETLAALPESPPEANRVEQRLAGALSPRGDLTGELVERATGSEAVGFRRQRLTTTSGDLERDVRAWIGEVLPGARVSTMSIGPRDAAEDLRASFAMPGFARKAGTLAVVPLAPIGVERFLPRVAAGRTVPVELPSRSLSVDVVLEVPEGAVVDELPPAASDACPWAWFKSQATTSGRRVVVRHELRTLRARVGGEDLARLRAFSDAAFRAFAAGAVFRLP